MKKIYKFSSSFLFVIIWLIISSYFIRYWNIIHWEFIYFKSRSIFDKEFWFLIKNLLLGFDIGYYLEELYRFITYEIPKESFKYIPIFLFLKRIWIKKKD